MTGTGTNGSSGSVAPWRCRQTVRFGDVDRAGMVYYPRLLHYLHVAMETFFAEVLGIDYPRFLAEQRLGFPTVHLEADFRRPLRYGDEIEVETAIEKIGRSSVTWRYAVYRDGDREPAATARLVTVNMDLDAFAKRELAPPLRDRLAAAAGGRRGTSE